MTIKEKILQILEIKKIKKENFFTEIGVTYGNFKGDNKSRSLSTDLLVKILAEIPDLSAEWLLRGTGDMFINSGPGQQVNANQNSGTINATNYASAAADECRRLAEENKFLREELANKQRLIDYFTTQKN